MSWDQLKTGDCFNGFADTGGWKDTDVSPIRVDCRSMHEEVTGTFTIPGGRHYPGDDAVGDASDTRCEKYFARYGIDWDDSDLLLRLPDAVAQGVAAWGPQGHLPGV